MFYSTYLLRSPRVQPIPYNIRPGAVRRREKKRPRMAAGQRSLFWPGFGLFAGLRAIAARIMTEKSAAFRSRAPLRFWL
jgi:hypothetical protein